MAIFCWRCRHSRGRCSNGPFHSLANSCGGLLLWLEHLGYLDKSCRCCPTSCLHSDEILSRWLQRLTHYESWTIPQYAISTRARDLEIFRAHPFRYRFYINRVPHERLLCLK